MTATVEADGYRSRLLEKHGGDVDQALREACWTAVTLDAGANASLTAQDARQRAAESWGYLRKGNAYKRPVAPPRAEPAPLDVSHEDAPHG